MPGKRARCKLGRECVHGLKRQKNWGGRRMRDPIQCTGCDVNLCCSECLAIHDAQCKKSTIIPTVSTGINIVPNIISHYIAMYTSCYYRVLRVYQTTFTRLKASYDRGMTSVPACSRTVSVLCCYATLHFQKAPIHGIGPVGRFCFGRTADANVWKTIEPKNGTIPIYSLSNVNVARFTGSFNFDDQTCTSQNPSR